jgi:hypothetical protein
VLDRKAWVLVLINLHEIQTILESHIACFVDIIPESLIAPPWLLPFGVFIHGDIGSP